MHSTTTGQAALLLAQPAPYADLYASSGAKPQMDAADEVLTQLFPHQREALAWMISRENSNGLPPFWQASRTPAGLLYTNRWVWYRVCNMKLVLLVSWLHPFQFPFQSGDSGPCVVSTFHVNMAAVHT